MYTHYRIPIQCNPFVAHAILICDFVPFSHSLWRGIKGFMPFLFHFCRGSSCFSCMHNASKHGFVLSMHQLLSSFYMQAVYFHELCFRCILSFCCTFFIYQIWFAWIGRSAMHFRKSSFFLPLTGLPYISDTNCVNVTVALTYFLPREMWNVKSKLLLHIIE